MKIELDEDVARTLADYCRESDRAPQEVVNDRLRRFLAMEEFERVRKVLIRYAEAAGCFTDEDFLRVVDEVRREPAPGA